MSQTGSDMSTEPLAGDTLQRLTSRTFSASLEMRGWPPFESLRSQRHRRRGSMSSAIHTFSIIASLVRQSDLDMWPNKMTMAAMWSGMGDMKNAMSGKRISWLWITMMLCDVMIVRDVLVSFKALDAREAHRP